MGLGGGEDSLVAKPPDACQRVHLLDHALNSKLVIDDVDALVRSNYAFELPVTRGCKVCRKASPLDIKYAFVICQLERVLAVQQDVEITDVVLLDSVLGKCQNVVLFHLVKNG